MKGAWFHKRLKNVIINGFKNAPFNKSGFNLDACRRYTSGKLGDADAETAAVLLEADVDDRPFAPAVHACVPPLPWSFNESEHLARQPHREDLRGLRVCSVDPPGCRDIDDALSCRALDGEGLKVGIVETSRTSCLTHVDSKGRLVFQIVKKKVELQRPSGFSNC